MSCMMHECRDCEYFWGDNLTAFLCPKCGSSKVSNEFDEPDFDDEITEEAQEQ
jgi:Zn finger protein HypA/HybF involved in hydrogenase expression